MTHQVHLPLIMKSGDKLLKRPGFVVGASAGAVLDAAIYARMNLGLICLPNFLWSKFEPVPRLYDWEYLRSYFRIFYAAKAAGIPSMVTVFGVPHWAQVDQETGDTPMRLDCIPAFVDVLRKICRASPELVYLQILNEPDNVLGYEDHYGCLGDVKLYLEIMRQAAEIKVEFPGLILSTGMTTYTTDFFRGFIAGGGAEYIDQWNVHFYQGWNQTDPQQLGDEVNAIRSLDRSTIWLTEANLLNDMDATTDYLEAQAEWIERTGWIARELGCEVYAPYALRSNWRNADILGRLAEKTLTDMAATVNGVRT